MDVRQEIAKQVERLPQDLQQQVLRFVASLSASSSSPAGERGASLRKFSSSLDSLSAREMIEAIEEECERVDAGTPILRSCTSVPGNADSGSAGWCAGEW
jgi:hypothetical protein